MNFCHSERESKNPYCPGSRVGRTLLSDAFDFALDVDSDPVLTFSLTQLQSSHTLATNLPREHSPTFDSHFSR